MTLFAVELYKFLHLYLHLPHNRMSQISTKPMFAMCRSSNYLSVADEI